MKKLVILFLLLAFQQTFAQWESCSGTFPGLIDFDAFDFGEIQTVLTKEGVFSTSDAGKTWSNPQFRGLEDLKAITKHNQDLYFGCADLYKSTDKGFSWIKMTGKYPGYFYSLQSVDNKLYAATSNGFFVSTDDAVTWKKFEIGVESAFESKFIVSGDNLIYTGSHYAYASQHGEGEWIRNDSVPYLRSISEREGILYGISQDQLLASDDNGKSYKVVCKDENEMQAYDQVAAVENGALILVYPGKLYRYDANTETVDSNFFDKDFIRALSSYNNHSLAWGDNGIYEFSQDGKSWVLYNDRALGYPTITLSSTENKAYFSTQNGLYLTSDNGDHWVNKNMALPKKFFLKLFASENTIVASTYRDTVLVSRNGGDTWKVLSPTPKVGPSTISSICADDNYIYAGALYGTEVYGGLYSRSDNDDVWKRKLLNKPLEGVSALTLSGNTLIAAFDWVGGIYSSNDQGESWVENYKFPPYSKLSEMSAYQNTIAVLFGNNISSPSDQIIISEDGGETWNKKPHGLGNKVSFTSVHVYGSLIIACSSSDIYVSTDKGSSYKKIMDGIPTVNNITGVRVCGDYLFAGTSFGPFRGKIADFGITSAQEVVAGLNTFTVYPNPTSDFIVVKSDIGQAYASDISIYDTRGNVVLQAKSNNFEIQRIEVSSLPTGAYWVRRGSESKMIIKN